MNCAACSSALPPISPISTIAFGVRVGLEQRERVDEVGADDRVAADADAGGLAEALRGELLDDLVGERAAAATMPTLPGL